MAQTKTKQQKKGKAETKAKPKAGEPQATEAAIKAAALSPADRRFLVKVTRLLLAIQNADIARKVAKLGYTAGEHHQAWELLASASGSKRSLDHCLVEQSAAPPTNDAERRRLLAEVDDFENTWFPRVRAIIRRHVPPAERDAFAAAFFNDLVQQPLGPGVIDSVTTFLERIANLRKSTLLHAATVRDVLVSRGLTDQTVAEIEHKLERLKASFSDAARPETPPVSAVEVAHAQEAQLAALSSLRDWLNDWGTTFRTALSSNDLRRLGLLSTRQHAADSDEGEDEDEDEDADDGEGEGDEG